ncbi:MAG: cation:proton antiporter [Candidatus Binatia bacterium]
MTAVLAFAVTLLLAVLISDLAHRSVLSTAVLFLLAGFLAGDGMLSIMPLQADNPVISIFAELALFSVLFTDGMRVGFRDLTSAWELPGRALFLGLPLTLLITAALAYVVADLSWPEALLFGAILSPTDPVFAAAIVGREEVPARLRHLLNVESGLNDGLALPLVLIMLAMLGETEVGFHTFLELVIGVAVGIVVPWIAIRLEETRFFATTSEYEPLHAFAIGLLVFSIMALTHANEFLAAFAAGITIATMSKNLREEFQKFGELVTELLKLAGLLVFGALILPQFLGEISWSGYILVLLVLLLARPLALGVALLGSQLTSKEKVTVAWFGPKGFASVFFGLLILEAGVERSDHLFHLVAVVIAGSIIAHSSTDVLVARWFHRHEAEPLHTVDKRAS